MNRMPGAPDLPPGYRLISLETVGSTSDEARRMACEEGAAEGTIVWAQSQETGRGRYGRIWESPPGNMYLSIVLRPDVTPAVAGQLSFVTAVALADSLASVMPSGARLSLKWPNDILANGKKLAGILLESEVTRDHRLDYVVIGVGVNLAHAPDGATSLVDTGARDITPGWMVEHFIAALDQRLAQWERDGFAGIRTDWLSMAHGLDGPIRARLAKEEITGIFKGLDNGGALLLDTNPNANDDDDQTDNGDLRRITAGEVFFGE